MRQLPVRLSRRTLALGLAGIALLAVALSGIAHLVEGTGSDWTTVERADLSLTVDVAGSLKAVHSQALGPPAIKGIWELKIAHMSPEGSEVEKGEVVLAFDASELELRLQEITAAYQSARKELEKKETDITIQRRDDALRLAEAEANRQKAALKLDRPPELVAANELAKVRIDLDTAEKEIAYLHAREESLEVAFEAEAGVLREERDRAAGRVREIKAAITEMEVKAPRSGTVIYTTTRRGEKKKVGDPCWREEKVLEIPDLTEMTAEGEVDEVDAGKLAVGQGVKLRLEAYPDTEITGRVESISATVGRRSWRSPLKVVRVRLRLDETDPMRMRPEMRFRGTIEVERIRDALVVARDAVVNTPDGPMVRRRRLTGLRTVPVTLGRSNTELVEVLEGLSVGDRVLRVIPPPRL
jgi:HlyD family secretion protein